MEDSLNIPSGVASTQQNSRVEMAEWTVALAITLAAIILHLVFFLNAGGLWRDEVTTVNLATKQTLSEVWDALIYDSFPMLPYYAVRLWVQAGGGGSDVALRLFGLIIGLSGVAVLWLERRALGNRVPLLSLALFGLSPVLIRWGDSIRGYGLGVLLILATYALMWRVVESPTAKRISLAVVAGVLSVQCIYQNAFLLLAICLGGVAVCVRNGAWKKMAIVLGIGASAAISLLPYMGTIERAKTVFVTAQMALPISRFWLMFATAISSGNSVRFWAWVVLILLGVGAAIYLLMSRPSAGVSDRRKDIAVFCLTTLVAATIGFLVFVRMMKLPTQPWYYLILMAVYAVSIEGVFGVFAVTTARRIDRLLVTAGIVVLTVVPTWQQVHARQTNVDVIASTLETQAAQEDLILITPWYCGITFQQYYKGAASWTTPPPVEDLTIHRYDLLRAQMSATDPIESVLRQISTTLKNGHQVWLVGGLPFLREGQTPPTLPPAPHGPWGWSSDPYLEVWALQIAHFVQTHALHVKVVPIPVKGPVNQYENLPVLVVWGWK